MEYSILQRGQEGMQLGLLPHTALCSLTQPIIHPSFAAWYRMGTVVLAGNSPKITVTTRQGSSVPCQPGSGCTLTLSCKVTQIPFGMGCLHSWCQSSTRGHGLPVGTFVICGWGRSERAGGNASQNTLVRGLLPTGHRAYMETRMYVSHSCNESYAAVCTK